MQKAKEKLEEKGIKSAFITSISSIDVIGTKPEEQTLENRGTKSSSSR